MGLCCTEDNTPSNFPSIIHAFWWAIVRILILHEICRISEIRMYFRNQNEEFRLKFTYGKLCLSLLLSIISNVQAIEMHTIEPTIFRCLQLRGHVVNGWIW